MDRIYVTTKRGRRALRDGSISGEEAGIVQYIKDNKSASMAQLETIGERWIVKNLQRKKLIKELME